MEKNNKVSIGKKNLKVEDGKVIIDSPELLSAIEDEGLDLYSDKSFNEEANQKEISVGVSVSF